MKKYIFIVLLAFLFDVSVFAGKKDYYLEVMGHGCSGQVSLNGFSLYDSSKRGFSKSMVLGTFLQKGSNEFNVSFQGKQGVENIYLDVKVSSHPHGIKRESKNEEVIFLKQFRHASHLLQGGDSNHSIIIGDKNESGGFELESKNGSATLAMKIGDKSILSDIPYSLKYNGLITSLKDLKIHFLQWGTSKRVAFEYDSMKFGSDEIVFSSDNIVLGSHLLDYAGFDSILISGKIENDQKVKISSIEFINRFKRVQVEEIFSADLDKLNSWSQGEQVLVSENTVNDVWGFIENTHKLFDEGKEDSFKSIFLTKAQDLAHTMGQSVDEVYKRQIGFLKKITSQPNWGLEPIEAKHMYLSKINNTVLKVESVLGSEIFVSKLLSKPNGKKDRFRIPLYISKIKGEWKIIK